MNTAQIILQQIKSIDFWALGAWGAKELVAMNDGLKFKSSGSVRWKGYVYIQYDEGKDLYNVIFAQIRKHQWIERHRVEGVFVEDLVNVIDSRVG